MRELWSSVQSQQDQHVSVLDDFIRLKHPEICSKTVTIIQSVALSPVRLQGAQPWTPACALLCGCRVAAASVHLLGSFCKHTDYQGAGQDVLQAGMAEGRTFDAEGFETRTQKRSVRLLMKSFPHEGSLNELQHRQALLLFEDYSNCFLTNSGCLIQVLKVVPVFKCA